MIRFKVSVTLLGVQPITQLHTGLAKRRILLLASLFLNYPVAMKLGSRICLAWPTAKCTGKSRAIICASRLTAMPKSVKTSQILNTG